MLQNSFYAISGTFYTLLNNTDLYLSYVFLGHNDSVEWGLTVPRKVKQYYQSTFCVTLSQLLWFKQCIPDTYGPSFSNDPIHFVIISGLHLGSNGSNGFLSNTCCIARIMQNFMQISKFMLPCHHSFPRICSCR